MDLKKNPNIFDLVKVYMDFKSNPFIGIWIGSRYDFGKSNPCPALRSMHTTCEEENIIRVFVHL